MTTNTHYTLFAILLHWISALVIIAMFVLGWWMVDLDYYSSWYQTAPYWHMSVGILLAIVTLIRFINRLWQPVKLDTGSKLERALAHIAHLLMYLLLAAIFITGYLIPTGDGSSIEVFDWFTVPSVGRLVSNQKDLAGDLHEYLAYGLIALVIFHGLAAVKHHFINKDHTLKKMLKPK